MSVGVLGGDEWNGSFGLSGYACPDIESGDLGWHYYLRTGRWMSGGINKEARACQNGCF